MIFATHYERHFHFDIVDNVDEMKDPGSVRPANGHVRMSSRVSQIEINLATDEIVHHHVLAWRTKSQRALVFEDVATVLKFFQVAFVNISPLALKVRTEISSDVWPFVPIQAEPA